MRPPRGANIDMTTAPVPCVCGLPCPPRAWYCCRECRERHISETALRMASVVIAHAQREAL